MTDRVFLFVPVVDGERISCELPGVLAKDVEQAVDRWCDLLSYVEADGAPDRFDILEVGRKAARWGRATRSGSVKVGELVVEFEAPATVH